METMQTNAAPQAHKVIDPLRDAVRLMPDMPERWDAMKGSKPMPFAQAAEVIRAAARKDGARTDLGAGALDKLAVDYDSTGLVHLVKTEQRGDRLVAGSDPVPMREHAFAQLCDRAKAPPQYLRRLPAKLAKACLQHGLVASAADRAGMLRMAGGQVRAVVSAGTRGYTPLDDERVLEALERALGAHGLLAGVMARGIATGPITVLRLTAPAEGIAVLKGDVIEWGLDIANGELGNRSLQIDPSTLRLTCTNGMRGWSRAGDARRLRHVGDPTRLYEQLVDAIPAALNDARGQVDLLREATTRIIDDVGEEFSILGSRFGLQQEETRAVAAAVFAERKIALPAAGSAVTIEDVMGAVHDMSVYEVTNGVTAYAQQRGTARRLELEEAALRYTQARAS